MDDKTVINFAPLWRRERDGRAVLLRGAYRELPAIPAWAKLAKIDRCVFVQSLGGVANAAKGVRYEITDCVGSCSGQDMRDMIALMPKGWHVDPALDDLSPIPTETAPGIVLQVELLNRVRIEG